MTNVNVSDLVSKAIPPLEWMLSTTFGSLPSSVCKKVNFLRQLPLCMSSVAVGLPEKDAGACSPGISAIGGVAGSVSTTGDDVEAFGDDEIFFGTAR
jgi:hypothetical protein